MSAANKTQALVVLNSNHCIQFCMVMKRIFEVDYNMRRIGVGTKYFIFAASRPHHDVCAKVVLRHPHQRDYCCRSFVPVHIIIAWDRSEDSPTYEQLF